VPLGGNLLFLRTVIQVGEYHAGIYLFLFNYLQNVRHDPVLIPRSLIGEGSLPHNEFVRQDPDLPYIAPVIVPLQCVVLIRGSSGDDFRSDVVYGTTKCSPHFGFFADITHTPQITELDLTLFIIYIYMLNTKDSKMFSVLRSRCITPLPCM